MEKLITRKEAAEILGISIATLDAARNNGLISLCSMFRMAVCILLRQVSRSISQNVRTGQSLLLRAASSVAMQIPKISAASFRVMSFSIDHIPSNLSRLSSCFQNHMNTLAAETASAWYLILNRKRLHKKVIASYFNITQFSSHLPRNPDDGNIAGLRWRGCHNSAASFYSCAAGFPPSL